MHTVAFYFSLILIGAGAFTPAPLLKPRSASQTAPPSFRTPAVLHAAANDDTDAVPFFGSNRTPFRTIPILCGWVCLTAYITLGAPGQDEVHKALDSDLLAKLIANPIDETVPSLFTVLFNFMGIWPAWYAATLLPGASNQKPLPAAPFLAASVAIGMFALSPYLSVREYRGAGSVTQKDLNSISRWFEGKLNGALLFFGALGLSIFGLTSHSGDVALTFSEFKGIFDTQLFPHATTLDFTALWALSFGVMAEDMERRGMDASKAPLFCALPILGHCTYLLLRSPLPEE